MLQGLVFFLQRVPRGFWALFSTLRESRLRRAAVARRHYLGVLPVSFNNSLVLSKEWGSGSV